MTDDVFYPNLEEVLVLHAEVRGILPSRILDDVRDLNLLESALARPQNAAVYEGAGISRQAATLLWGLVRNHPFIDGNKRTGYVVTQTFLRANGISLDAAEDDRFNLVVAVAEGMAIDDVETWIGKHIVVWPWS